MAVTETRFRYEGADGTGLAGFGWTRPPARGRHEMQNDTDRDEVVADLAVWLDRTVAGLARAA